MKKYLIVLGIFLASLGFIGSNLVRNIHISEEMQSYENIKQLAYEMNLLLKDQENIIHHLDTFGKQHFISFHQKVNNKFVYFVKTLKKSDDEKFIKIASNMDEKLLQLKGVYESLQQSPSVNIETLEKEIASYNINIEVESAVKETLKKLNRLNEETSSIVNALVGSSVFLLLFGVIIYI